MRARYELLAKMDKEKRPEKNQGTADIDQSPFSGLSALSCEHEVV